MVELPNRRRRFYIDKRLQGMYALINISFAGLVALLVGLELIRSFFVEFGWPGAGKPFSLPTLLFILKLIIMVTVGGGFFWMLSAFAGHRIAGPIYRLDQSLKEVTKGNYNLRIQFRKKDFFQHVATTFNEMNESIEQRFKKQEELLEEIKEKAKNLPQESIQAQELKKLLGVE